MEYIVIVLKLIIGLSILNVWLLRGNKSTQWRGGNANNIKEEFKAYGLPIWFMYLIGTIKVILALMLVSSIYFTGLEQISAYGIAILMLGAVSMHFKIGDPLKKAFPSFLFLTLALIIALV